MTPEQIKQLAKQAGGMVYPARGVDGAALTDSQLTEFVRLVRESVLSEARQAIEMANADRHIYVPDCVQIIEELK